MVEEYDVVVVGAGPAGSSAARAAAAAGLRVLLLDRAAFPRYKTCGGGLIGPSLRSIEGVAGLPVRADVRRCGFSYRGGRTVLRTASAPVIRTVLRPEFDEWLVAAAVAAGATFRDGCAVGSVVEAGSIATVSTTYGEVRARTVIAADGASGRLSRQLGVQVGRVDLGLEVELAAPAAVAAEWADRIHLDWGPLPGSYGWVFPKGETLTVGVIAARGAGEATRAYLRDLLRWQGLDGLDVVQDSGHLTRCRTPGSPVAGGRLLAVGDAAGLLEPWTREGISFALRSGSAAGAACAAADPAAAYRAALEAELLPEMAAGERCLVAYERRPRAFHELITRTPLGWRGFVRLASGETTLDRAMAHPSVRLGLGLLGR
ncbi:geranylgeranyl reductase family protein [Nocardioides sp. BP30]|uniref:geranylgeranyl reductase family protein n=1 Tax=Nocardioides sp. BP30 TaxID=3036374 RepID=UPI0024690F07|nr:geranylgeranyl reductase family protein [Nocardioides sp. BP30]WGL52966.1 geranylgeranyl reductase family protein [Nocardioides sp. BP30]